MLPIIDVLGSADGPLGNTDLNQAVAEHMGLGESTVGVLHDPNNSDQPEAFYRMAWARTYLKKVGLLDNQVRGQWALTERAQGADQIDPDELVRQVRTGVTADALSADVPDHVADELLELYQTFLADGKSPTGAALEACYHRFRERFGPAALRQLEGDNLLNNVHGRGTKDSLVYWLEFKDDHDFPNMFGGIGGGSALKFGIYQNSESGDWMTGAPTSQRRLSSNDALTLVRTQRDQLVAGGEFLQGMVELGESIDYADLQEGITQVAPDLADTAWGHKYFSLIAPTLLDDFHALRFQRHHLIRLHKVPAEGRYENARFFAGIAQQLSIPITHLTALLGRRHGMPHGYWRVGTSLGETGQSEWPRMRDGGFAAVGWDGTGTLEAVERNQAGKDYIRRLIEEHHPSTASAVTKASNQLYQFSKVADSGDTVVAMHGSTVFGIGEITGPYFHDPEDGPFPHRRPVTWRAIEEWKLPTQEAMRTTFARLGKYSTNLIEVERRLAMPDAKTGRPSNDRVSPRHLTGLLMRIEDALHRKGQVILYGPPGTGKTYWAEAAIRELASRSWFSNAHDQITSSQKAELEAGGGIERCCFHPAYGYEDFLVGYRPVERDGTLIYEITDGVFTKLCRRAASQPHRHFFLLIDEINRGDIPRIFGELLGSLEKDKRGTPVTVPLFEDRLVVPPNVFLVGTMNTADRSVALLDAALRRRFAFIELMPDTTVLEGANVGGLPLGPWLSELNRRIVEHAGRDARNLQIGHSYLLHDGVPVRDVKRFAELLRDDILPLLQEYCYEDFGALEKILGGTIVLRDIQRFNDALFEPSGLQDLIVALLSAFDKITATPAAASADTSPDADEDYAEEDYAEEADDTLDVDEA